MKTQEFLDKIGPMAVRDMKKTGILASLTIAQAILESSWGDSGLTKHANNLFGIKGSYQGQSYTCRTFEYVDGKRVDVDAAFRKYPSWQESVNDHSSLFLRLDRYANLRGEKDYATACRNVQADGYATAPNYADSLIKLIEQYNLAKYDVEDDRMLKAGEFSSSMEAAALQFFLTRRGYDCDLVPSGEKWAVAVTKAPSGRSLADAQEGLMMLNCYSE